MLIAINVALLLLLIYYASVRMPRQLSACSALVFALIVVFEGSHLYYCFSKSADEELLIRCTWALGLMWIGLILGMELIRSLFSRKYALMRDCMRCWRQLPFIDDYCNNGVLAFVCLLQAALLVGVFLYEGKATDLLRFLSLSGDTEAVAELRGTAGGSKVYLYNLTLSSTASFLSFVLILRAIKRRTCGSCAGAIGFGAVVAAGKLASFSRSAFPFFLLQILLVWFLLRDNRIRLKAILFAVIIGMVLVAPLFYHYIGDMAVSEFVITHFLNRVLLAPYNGMFNYFSTFPDIAPHALGRNIDLIRGIVYNGESGYVPAMILFAEKSGNYYGSFNAMFIAEAWVDFSYYGILIASLLLGAIALVVDLFTFSRGKSVSSIATLACLVYAVWVVTNTALQTALLSGGLLSVPVFCAVLDVFRWSPELSRHNGGAPPLVRGPAVIT